MDPWQKLYAQPDVKLLAVVAGQMANYSVTDFSLCRYVPSDPCPGSACGQQLIQQEARIYIQRMTASHHAD